MRVLFMVIGFLVIVPLTALAQNSAPTPCPPDVLSQSLLVGGIQAGVSTADPIDFRSDPSDDARLINPLPNGAVMFVVSGPQCAEDQLWWQVKYAPEGNDSSDAFGWVAEIKKGTRQLEPLIPNFDPPLPQNLATINQTNLSQVALQGEIGPFGDFQSFTWSPDGSHLAINTLHAVWIYDVVTHEAHLMPVRLPTAAMSFWNQNGAVAFSADGQLIATAGIPDGDLRYWSVAGDLVKDFPTQASDYAGVAAIAPDLSKWAIAHGDGSISILDAASNSVIQTLTGHTVVGALAFTPDGATLVSMGSFPYTSESLTDNTVRIWDVGSGQLRATLTVSMPPSSATGERSQIAISPHGHRAAVFAYLDGQDGNYPSAAYVIDLPSASLRQQFTIPSDGNSAIGNTAFGVNDHVLAINTLTSIIFLNDINGTQVDVMPFQQSVQDVAFSPDGRWMAVAHEGDNFNQSVIQLWGVAQ